MRTFVLMYLYAFASFNRDESGGKSACSAGVL